jgi:AcrR family transcriptional regulator
MTLPRRYAEPVPSQDDERSRIMEAAHRCLARSNGATVSITDILAAAGLSTRAFYRHFESKDSMLLAMVRRDSDRVMAELAAEVDSAGTGAAALRAWIHGMLRLASEEPRRRRVLVLASEEARRARGYDAELARFQDQHQAAIAEILRRGLDDGSFPRTDPASDARAVQAVLSQALEAQLRNRGPLSAEAGEQAAADFIFRALGAAYRPTANAGPTSAA